MNNMRAEYTGLIQQEHSENTSISAIIDRPQTWKAKYQVTLMYIRKSDIGYFIYLQ